MEIPFYRFWPQGTPLGKFSVGSTVQLLFDGVKTDFLVAHHGPTRYENDAIYTGATWLLAKKSFEQMTAQALLFDGSNVFSYVSNYLPRFSNKIQNAVLTVPIRDFSGDGQSTEIQTKIFLLNDSLADNAGETGVHLDLFDAGDVTYKASGGDVTPWWTCYSYTNAKEKLCVKVHYNNGGVYQNFNGTGDVQLNSGYIYGVLPAMCLPDKILVDKNGFIG